MHKAIVKRIVKRRISKYKNAKSKSLKTFNDGYELGDTLVKSWNSQPNPPKVYIDGYRIHHGLVGAILGLIGAIIEKPALTGFGAKLAIDDIADIPNWLNFEHNNSIQYTRPYIPLAYNGFA